MPELSLLFKVRKVMYAKPNQAITEKGADLNNNPPQPFKVLGISNERRILSKDNKECQKPK